MKRQIILTRPDEGFGMLTSGDGRTLIYSTADNLTKATHSSNTLEFDYGADRQRYQCTEQLGTTNKKTFYVGNAERYEQTQGGNTTVREVRRRIGREAQVQHTISSTGAVLSTVLRYHLLDHLGSMITTYDSTPTLMERTSYDAWGERRSYLTMTDWGRYQPAFFSRAIRGYTSHEHADAFGLIHMNGRVYDGTLGRFLQADPFVQSPGNVQSYNRYSYVLNNPLAYTDPSGYFSFT